MVFEDVIFSYSPDRPLIEDLDLTAEPGQTVAIVGPTGAGKTTLVNLIMRFYELDGGRITLDGRDIATIPRQELRANIGMVLQDTWLFGGTIRDNIAYGRPGATEEEILDAARATYVDRFVHHLPDGYDTVIDEEGDNISAGQKQLLTIARAFLAQPAILILDEATSSVDTRTEVLIQEAMHALRTGRTSFVIAHRLSTIRGADTILVMEDGHIVEQGSHDELLSRDGAYFRLYSAQFAGAAVDDESVRAIRAIGHAEVGGLDRVVLADLLGWAGRDERTEVEHEDVEQSAITRSMSCSTSRIAMPSSRSSVRTSPSLVVSMSSSPDAGSSRSTTLGLVARARPSSTSRA